MIRLIHMHGIYIEPFMALLFDHPIIVSPHILRQSRGGEWMRGVGQESVLSSQPRHRHHIRIQVPVSLPTQYPPEYVVVHVAQRKRGCRCPSVAQRHQGRPTLHKHKIESYRSRARARFARSSLSPPLSGVTHGGEGWSYQSQFVAGRKKGGEEERWVSGEKGQTGRKAI
ncbi:hypothetical protein VTK26DRAFT_8265 [Humicola hyalothermophila]